MGTIKVSDHAKNQQNDQNVIIIGAGITGLLIAQGLSKANIQFSLCEAEPNLYDLRTCDWTIAIHWALPMLYDLLPPELSERIQEAQTDPFAQTLDVDDAIILHHGETGEQLAKIPVGKCRRVSRRRMRALCAEGLNVQCNKALVDIQRSTKSETITAIFADGTSVTGTALIGADGPYSVVRRILLGPEKSAPTVAPFVAPRIAIRYGDAEKASAVRGQHPLHTMAAHPNGTFSFIAICDVPDPAKPETWTFTLQSSWAKTDDSPVTLEDLKARHAGFSDPFGGAYAWIPDGTPVGGNRLSYWEPIPWDNWQGRISLAGDAAHPMTPHRGQGLQHVIADVAHYVRALQRVQAGETTLSEAIDAYDTEVIARGGAEVRMSYQNTQMLHHWETLMESPLMRQGTKKGV